MLEDATRGAFRTILRVHSRPRQLTYALPRTAKGTRRSDQGENGPMALLPVSEGPSYRSALLWTEHEKTAA